MSEDVKTRRDSSQPSSDPTCPQPDDRPLQEKRSLKPVSSKIGEGDKNLEQRGEWFRRRSGGGG